MIILFQIIKKFLAYKALFSLVLRSTGASSHQDSLYVQPEDSSGFITSWLSLVDLLKDNMGNLVVYPETHKRGTT